MDAITRRNFVAGALATAAVGVRAAETTTPLHGKVNALPAQTPEQRRKKALLLWALEDASAAQAAGMDDDAKALLTDVEAALDRALGTPAPVNQGLFPAIATKQNNPWLDATEKKLRTLVATGQKFPRGTDPDKKELGIKAGYPYIQLGQEGSLLAHAMGSPETEFYGDATLIAPMMRRFTASYEVITPGSKRLKDFGVSPHIGEMYALLNASFPDLILPSRRRVWENALTLNAEAILAEPAEVFSDPDLSSDPLEKVFLHPGNGDCYPNAQSHLMVCLLFTGLALKNNLYLQVAAGGVNLMATAFYPDGATAYIDFQNECFTYHGIMIEDLARYWQVTGNAKALELVRSARWYYPLSITPQGVAEYSSAPCWKHYWNAVKGTTTASVIASLMGCEYNALVALNSDPEANWLAATLYKPVRTGAWWDNAMLYDRNIEGPRGRFGQYSFCGTARNTLGSKRGKLTYVGNLWVDDPMTADRRQRSWPINAGLDGAWAEVRMNTNPETVNRWDTHACLSREESLASMASESFGTVTAHYQLAQYSKPPIAFAGTQHWLLTQQRLVGLLTLESLADQEAFSMGFAIKMVCGRDNSGIRKEWLSKGPNVYEYGAMTVRLWPLGDKILDLVSSGVKMTGYTDTFSGNSGKCGLLTLSNIAKPGVPSNKGLYAKGVRYHAAVEIYPTVFDGASSLRLLDCPAGLFGMELVEAKQTLQLIDNPTESASGYAPLLKGAMLHRSGERKRLAFLPAVTGVTPEPASSLVAIPAGEHVILRRV